MRYLVLLLLLILVGCSGGSNVNCPNVEFKVGKKEGVTTYSVSYVNKTSGRYSATSSGSYAAFDAAMGYFANVDVACVEQPNLKQFINDYVLCADISSSLSTNRAVSKGCTAADTKPTATCAWPASYKLLPALEKISEMQCVK